MLDLPESVSVDALELGLVADQVEIDRLRARQLDRLRALDRAQVVAMDGSRSLLEWVAARLDIEVGSARPLVEAARRLADHPRLEAQMQEGEVTLDRALAAARLADAGADDGTVAASFGFDLAGVRRLTNRRRRFARRDQQQVFRDRYLVLQPSLDAASGKLWGELPGPDFALVETALTRRGDTFGVLPDGTRPARGQRMADALVAVARDSIDPETGDGTGNDAGSVPLVTVFVDAAVAAACNGEAGAELAAGPRVGPGTLEEILCDGVIEVTGVTADGVPLGVGQRSRSLSPRLRRYILWRDGGCVIDGCRSRYRLQPHHLTPRSEGGTDDPASLATLCWFHHHVVVHGYGYRIDLTTPPHRRRFHRHRTGTDPPPPGSRRTFHHPT